MKFQALLLSAEIYLWTKQTRFPPRGVSILVRKGRQWVSEWVSEVCGNNDQQPAGAAFTFCAGTRRVLASFREVPKAGWDCLWGQGDGRTALSSEVPPFPSAVKTQWFESSARYPCLKVLREDGLAPRPHALPCEQVPWTNVAHRLRAEGGVKEEGPGGNRKL